MFLEDRAARVRDGGDETEQNRQGQGTHEIHHAPKGRAVHPPADPLIAGRVILVAYTSGSTSKPPEGGEGA
ncbi:hypothetical protein Slala02_04790 [Streptomyces lavendulae subsp. lavendulae]|nr:hypothetical protein Slala01_11240 [Streptomyces lavendulae subsp. lavendulae]GLX24659.1 hypothetical protein Slala02_04790 [Streptomyces lavendulae subsp. lavendulae]